MALPHHSHYHKETQKIMLRVQQISGQTIPLVFTEHGQQARSASAGSGCKSVPQFTLRKETPRPGKGSEALLER